SCAAVRALARTTLVRQESVARPPARSASGPLTVGDSSARFPLSTRALRGPRSAAMLCTPPRPEAPSPRRAGRVPSAVRCRVTPPPPPPDPPALTPTPPPARHRRHPHPPARPAPHRAD